jgi:hypothetical protein
MKKTKSALMTKLLSLTGVTPIAYPNRVFAPPDGATWIKVDFIPADSNPVTLGEAGDDELTGFFQVAIMSPAGSGDGSGIELSDTISAGFKNGSHLIYQDRVVRISHSQNNPGNEVKVDTSVWYPNYLTVYWSARRKRN